MYDTWHTLIYNTLQLSYMFFFTHLLFFWAGWLPSDPVVCYNNVCVPFCNVPLCISTFIKASKKKVEMSRERRRGSYIGGLHAAGYATMQ
jgi:hypothetical protein